MIRSAQALNYLKRGMCYMICPKCKAEITDGSKFCIKCGARIQDAPQQTNTDKPAEAENAKVPEKPADTDTAKAPEKPADAPAAPAPENPAPSVPAPEKPAESAKAAGVVCLRCGHAVKDGMKFCTKCGAPVGEGASPSPVKSFAEHAEGTPAPAAPVKKPQVSVPSAPAPAPAEKEQPETEKSHSKGLIFIIVLVIIALIVAILLILKSTGLLSRGNSGQGSGVQTSSNENNGSSDEDEEPDPEPVNDPEPEEDPEVIAARLAEIEQIKNDIDEAVKAGDESEGVNGYYPAALDGYTTLASEYDMAEEVSDDALDILDKYAWQVRYSVSLLDGQKVSSGLYIQSLTYYDNLVSYAKQLSDAGIDADVNKITAERDSLRDTYRTKYIEAINEISSRENWSRDEAWELMADAASILDDNGNPELFDEDDLDDPLRLRYIYSLAWATRKHLETGFADKSITAEEALDTIDELLPETDYNLQLLFDAIYYAEKAGVDATPYEEAFNTIMEKIGENQGLIIIMDHARADDTHIDLNHFWAFNDISPDANPDIQVSTTNGTTAETRAWIRDNIRVSR